MKLRGLTVLLSPGKLTMTNLSISRHPLRCMASYRIILRGQRGWKTTVIGVDENLWWSFLTKIKCQLCFPRILNFVKGRWKTRVIGVDANLRWTSQEKTSQRCFPRIFNWTEFCSDMTCLGNHEVFLSRILLTCCTWQVHVWCHCPSLKEAAGTSCVKIDAL